MWRNVKMKYHGAHTFQKSPKYSGTHTVSHSYNGQDDRGCVHMQTSDNYTKILPNVKHLPQKISVSSYM